MKPLLILVCAAGLVVLVAPAVAQVGSGWVIYSPSSSIQLDGSEGIESYPGDSTQLRNEGASFTFQDGIETFALHDPISNRAERRVRNTYLGGAHQFEGEVRVSPPTNDESVMQIFGGNSGATTQMIRAYSAAGGSLRKIPGSVALIENVYGVWVKVNVIHDVGANVVRTYINGQLAATGDGEAVNAGDDGWYHKYGCYGTLRTGSAKVEWRNVKHFRQGVAPDDAGSDSGSPPEDGGAQDAALPEDAASDAGAGGTGGSAQGGAGGSGAGGSGGSGAGQTGGGAGHGRGDARQGGGSGAGGSGASPGPSRPSGSATAGGCRLAGAGAARSAFGFVAGLVLVLGFAARTGRKRSHDVNH